MRIWLVVGVHPIIKPQCWVLVAREGGSLSLETGIHASGITFDVMKAQLFPFSREGKAAAIEAAGRVFSYIHEDWRGFTARVLVTGHPDRPGEVVAAVSLGEAPVAFNHFDRGGPLLRGADDQREPYR